MKNPINKSNNKSKKRGKNKGDKGGKNKKFSLKACQKKFVGGKKFTSIEESENWIGTKRDILKAENMKYSGWVIRGSGPNDNKLDKEFYKITPSLFSQFYLNYFTLYSVDSNKCLIVFYSHDSNKNNEAMPGTLENYYSSQEKLKENNLVITGYIDVEKVAYIPTTTTDKSKYDWLAIEGSNEIYIFMPINMGEEILANTTWATYIDKKLSVGEFENLIKEDQIQKAFASWYNIIQSYLGKATDEEEAAAGTLLQEWQLGNPGPPPSLEPPPSVEDENDTIYDIKGDVIPNFGKSHTDLGMIFEISGYLKSKTAYKLVVDHAKYETLYFLKENSKSSPVYNRVAKKFSSENTSTTSSKRWYISILSNKRYVIKPATNDNYITIERRSFGSNPNYTERWNKLIMNADTNTGGTYGSFLGNIETTTIDGKANKSSPNPNQKMMRIFRIRNVSNRNKQIMWIDPNNYNNRRGWFLISKIVQSIENSAFLVKFLEKTTLKTIDIFPDKSVLNSAPWDELIHNQQPIRSILKVGPSTKQSRVTFRSTQLGGKKRCKTKRKRKK